VIVLGFDTATPSTVVALRMADGQTLQARDDPEPGGHPGHTRVLAIARELLSQAGIEWSAVERVAVGLGPGRFTGLRVGVATARGLAQSLALELVGVSSLRALALAAAVGDGADGAGGVLAVIDARRGEAFAAAYPAAALGSAAELAEGELEFARALKPQDLEQAPALIEERGGPPAGGWLALGDGAVCFRAQLESAGLRVPADSSPLHLVHGAAICELALEAVPVASCEKILPDYRRTPDAALAREPAVTAPGTSA
jgi:tRNA threonylcarbamoyladenosine biosynthesis protein TsaB